MAKNRKEMYCDFGQIHPKNAHRVEVFIRNGLREIEIGDIIGGCRVLSIDAYGRKLETLPKEMIAKITFDGMPLLTIAEPYQKWDDNEELLAKSNKSKQE